MAYCLYCGAKNQVSFYRKKLLQKKAPLNFFSEAFKDTLKIAISYNSKQSQRGGRQPSRQQALRVFAYHRML